MNISRARLAGAQTELRGPTFTGDVWADPVLAETDGVMGTNVFFTPGARTNWHTHTRGQVLHVLAGEGHVCLRGAARETIRTGDVVFIRPGEEHWHGAARDSYLLHLAISLGNADWLDPVTDEEYGS